MSGEHTLWKGIVPMSGQLAREVQMAYVDGYCLALEDLLEELSRLQEIQTAHVAQEDSSWARIVPAVYRPLRRWTGQNLEQARKSLRHLKEVARERATAPEAKLGEGLRGDLGGVPGQPELQDPAPQ